MGKKINITEEEKQRIRSLYGEGEIINESSYMVRASVKPKADEVINFFVSKGLTPEQSAGIAGNLYVESGLNPVIKGDRGTSFGIAQWHNERWKQLINWSRKNGKDPNTISGQLEYLWWELNNTERRALRHLQQQRTIKDAAYSFALKFERPANPANPQRQIAATQIYQMTNNPEQWASLSKKSPSTTTQTTKTDSTSVAKNSNTPNMTDASKQTYKFTDGIFKDLDRSKFGL